jgi:hypothetical protein
MISFRLWHVLFLACGVGLPPLRDLIVIATLDDAERFFMLMSLVNTLSLLPSAVLLSRNVDEFPDLVDYFLFPVVWVLGVVLCWPLLVGNMGNWAAFTVVATMLASIFCALISHLLTSGGLFYVARFSHLPQVVLSLAVLLAVQAGAGQPDGADLLLASVGFGTVLYLIYFLLMKDRRPALAAAVVKYRGKPWTAPGRSRSACGAGRVLIIYLASTIPLAMSNFGQIILIMNLEDAAYDLLSVRISFYLSALLLFPFGYFVEKGIAVPIRANSPLLFCIVLGLNLMALTLTLAATPYVFCTTIVVLRYVGRSIIVAQQNVS